MRNFLHTLAVALLLAASLPAFATVFATVHGVIHDPQHRPIAGATVTMHAADSEFVLNASTSSDGEFELPQAPIGVYRLTVAATGVCRRHAVFCSRLGDKSGAAHSTGSSGRDTVLLS
ncbi:MAG: carboxypeptidase-like regulatory domain-containing protein [Terracidiphilus sp.]